MEQVQKETKMIKAFKIILHVAQKLTVKSLSGGGGGGGGNFPGSTGAPVIAVYKAAIKTCCGSLM